MKHCFKEEASCRVLIVTFPTSVPDVVLTPPSMESCLIMTGICVTLVHPWARGLSTSRCNTHGCHKKEFLLNDRAQTTKILDSDSWPE